MLDDLLLNVWHMYEVWDKKKQFVYLLYTQCFANWHKIFDFHFKKCLEQKYFRLIHDRTMGVTKVIFLVLIYL